MPLFSLMLQNLPQKTFVAITVCKMQENQNRAAKYTADNAYKRKR